MVRFLETRSAEVDAISGILMGNPTKLRREHFYKIELSNHSRFVTRMKSREFIEHHQKPLREIEDENPFGFYALPMFKSPQLRHFLLFASRPWTTRRTKYADRDTLTQLWAAHNCTLCPHVIPRHTMGTGYMQASTMIVGDAPGQGDGEKKYVDRTMVYGPTSHFLRRALWDADLYLDCWITNLLKCACPDNRRGFDEEYDNCWRYFTLEIEKIPCKNIILLGTHAVDVFNRKTGTKLKPRMKGHAFETVEIGGREIRVFCLYHPTYFIYSGLTYEDFSKQLIALRADLL